MVLSLSLGGCPPVNPTGDQQNLVFDRIVIDSADSGGAAAVMVADFDGDGKLDVISAWKDPGEVRLHLQQRANGVVSWQTVSLVSGFHGRGGAGRRRGGHGRRQPARCPRRHQRRPDPLPAPDSAATPPIPPTGTSTVIDASQGLDLNSWSDVQVADVDGDLQLEVVATLESPGGKVCIFNPPTRPTNGTGWTKVDVVVSGRNGAAQVIPIDMNADGAVDLLTIARGREPPTASCGMPVPATTSP